MRSLLVFGSLTLLVTLLVLNGILPRRASATDNGQGARPDDSPLELRYVDFEDEGPLLFRRHDREPEDRDQSGEPKEDQALAANEGIEGGYEDEAGRDEDWEDSHAESSQPVADAGPDRVLWVALDEIPLNGGNSSGDGLTFAWRQVAGIHELTIADPATGTTSASGFPLDWGVDWDDAYYEFELTVTDAYGQQAVDTVQFVVKAAPALRIMPRPRQRLAFRDGYLLAHYESWATNRVDTAETFEIRARHELFLEHLSGDSNFDVAVTERARAYVYRVTVYYQDGQATSWVEFFADSDERIPAILQFGVNWE